MSYKVTVAYHKTGEHTHRYLTQAEANTLVSNVSTLQDTQGEVDVRIRVEVDSERELAMNFAHLDEVVAQMSQAPMVEAN